VVRLEAYLRLLAQDTVDLRDEEDYSMVGNRRHAKIAKTLIRARRKYCITLNNGRRWRYMSSMSYRWS